MPNEYSADGKIILRSTNGNQMSLPRFFQLALDDGNGHTAHPMNARSGHYAWDMGTNNALTVPVRTPSFGTVTSAGDGWNGGMGTHVIVTDDSGNEHRFMHMVENSVTVSVGDSVSQGDTLGLIGSTGDSTTPHLHYDVMKDGSLYTDPIEAYDCSTLPSGWNFADAVADNQNWDYIRLDRGASDYGPPGGSSPSEPYLPDTPCYDISWAQSTSGTLNECLDAIAASSSGGVIIQVGAFENENNSFVPEDEFDPAQALAYAISKNLAVGVYFYNYADYTKDLTTAFQAALAYLGTIGATKDKLKLGVWIDTEYNSQLDYDPVPSSDKAVNYAYVERFMDVFDAAGYPVAGVYSSAAFFEDHYGSSRIGNKPIWAAYWVGSFSDVDRSSLDAYLPEADYTKVYIMQYTSSATVSGWSGRLDGNKVLTALPTSGGGGGGGGGEYTEVINVTVDVVPPKRIYFNPTPGLLDAATDLLSDRKATITVTTDADNADLYYTVDGSSPYQYTYVNGNLAYTVASNAQLYSSSITIYKDSHIRVVAVPSGTGSSGSFTEPLAKGSATYLFKYHNLEQSWKDEQKSYATSDGDISFFEENKQAFLRLHAEQTEEEILYAAVYKHDTQVVEEDAEDSASGSAGTTPEDERENTGSVGD